MMDTAKTVSIQMPTFWELFGALPEAWQTDEIRISLLAAYRAEVQMLLSTALTPECAVPQIRMAEWRQAGAQWICEFSASDQAIPKTTATNFHGQNTSQWRYAGAIVVEGGSVTCHH